MINKKIAILATALFAFAGCGKTTIESSIRKDDKITALREYDSYKENKLRKSRVVIGKVKNYTRFGTPRTDSTTKDILVSEFSNTGRFTVLEREDLDTVMEELAFSDSLGQKSLLARQKFLDTDYIVVGSVTKYALNTTGNKSIISKSKEQRAEVVIELKVIDVTNGKVWTETGEGSSRVEFSTILGTGTYGSYNSLEEEAFRAAVIQGVEKIVRRVDSTPWSAAVVKKSGGNIIINSGINSNLRIGTEMEVYKLGAPIEYRGEILGYEEKLVGSAIVTGYIGEDASTLRYDGENFITPAIVKIKK